MTRRSGRPPSGIWQRPGCPTDKVTVFGPASLFATKCGAADHRPTVGQCADHGAALPRAGSSTGRSRRHHRCNRLCRRGSASLARRRGGQAAVRLVVRHRLYRCVPVRNAPTGGGVERSGTFHPIVSARWSLTRHFPAWQSPSSGGGWRSCGHWGRPTAPSPVRADV